MVQQQDAKSKQRLEDGQAGLAAAIFYREMGWSVLADCPPDHVGVGKSHAKKCKSLGKAPLHLWTDYQDRLPTEAEILEWWQWWPNANVGMALGPVSGLIRVDVDGPGGEAKLLELSGGELPDTLEFTSGRANGGRGLLYQIPEGVKLRTTSDTQGEKEELRFQARGSQTVLPPSRHKDGPAYRWAPGRAPGMLEPALMPAWLVAEMRETVFRTNAAPSSNGDGHVYEGGRNTILTSLAGTMRRRGFSEDAIAAALLAENASRCSPPLDEDEVRGIAQSVSRYAPTDDAAATAETIILAYFRNLYRPVFRRGSSVVCEDGRSVLAGEACAVPSSKLIEQLAKANDAPTYRGGGSNRNGLPGFFKNWSRVAWGDLLAELPDEDTAELGDNAPAREEFRRLVHEAMLTPVKHGDVIGHTGVTQTEVRSLIGWCRKWAEPGPWRDIRDKQCWCKRRELPDGEMELVVAVRHGLFSQVAADRRLRDMGANTFTRRCERYGVGTSTRQNRPHGFSAIVLGAGFVADLIDPISSDEQMFANLVDQTRSKYPTDT
jgi:hypothetical protein